jgi:hypothetical protein
MVRPTSDLPAVLGARFRLTHAVFAVGLVLRCALVPVTHGPDFVVWDLASRATLGGSNIYADHPIGYPGGPYTYPPLFLYLELPFQWLALSTEVPFTVLGKIPIVLGDFLTAGLIVLFLRERRHDDRTIACASAMYLLNPLVLYNGAFYGRFDALCVGVFLLALHLHASKGPGAWRFVAAYAAAIGLKIYPIFLLPWLWMREQRLRWRLTASVAGLLGAISLPYVITSPVPYVRDILFYNFNRAPTNLSWQIALADRLSPDSTWVVGAALLALFVFALVCLAELDAYSAALIGILLFFLCSKVVIEQYFLWTFPFLIQNAVSGRSRADLGLFLLLSAAGMLSNHYLHPFGERVVPLNVAVAAGVLAYVVREAVRVSAARRADRREALAAASL